MYIHQQMVAVTLILWYVVAVVMVCRCACSLRPQELQIRNFLLLLLLLRDDWRFHMHNVPSVELLLYAFFWLYIPSDYIV